ncbi:MAG: Mth938-like domain-containing protein [Rhodospirillales bacterium]|nr:Mth938-like domain-containing protein [Rhodospirillales bacterium]
MSEGLSPGRKTISAYGDGGFRIADRRYEGSVIVFPDRVIPWSVTHKADVTPGSFADVIAGAQSLDILLLGCAGEPPLIAQPIREALKAHGIVIDAMDTGAACRTYNVLLGEGRAVAAALIAT